MNPKVIVLCALLLAGCVCPQLLAQQSASPTVIDIQQTTLQSSVTRLGINLGNTTYYDAGQIMKNLIFRNPGFEGGIYQSTIRCAAGTVTSCTDDDAASAWPAGFWNGATFEIFYGTSRGRSGVVAAYASANKKTGGTFTFSGSGLAPAPGDYMIVRRKASGDAATGWWPRTSGKGKISTNTSDLPPGTTGMQTVAVTAPGEHDSATLAAYFDGHSHRSFVLLNGTFRLAFQAKGIAGAKAIAVSLKRNGGAAFLDETVRLTENWAAYSLTFTAAESGESLQNVALQFEASDNDSFLLDDVSLVQTDSDPSNTTAFRDPVLNALKTLHPGTLRFWAGQLGDTLDNLLADPFGRQRSGYLAWFTKQEDISYGLHEFLQLCEAIGADPWFVVPSTFSTHDAANLIEYLAGSPSSAYGAKRAALGKTEPWTLSFRKIHLEFANEAWNGVFKGGTIEYPAPYGARAKSIFAAMRSNAFYKDAVFDLVLGGQAVSPERNRDIQNSCDNNDSFAIAPYMMGTLNSFANNEDLFGSTFAESEAYVSPRGTAEGVANGLVIQNQRAIRQSSHPAPLVTYEMNLSPLGGTITQAALDSYASSTGAGIAVAAAMLQQMAHGVAIQNLWNLSQYDFLRPDKRSVSLWGAAEDMGVTDRRRPQYLATQLVNQAIGGAHAVMLQTSQSGSNPTWNQPLLNSVQLTGAHYLQSFAFAGESTLAVVVFNLHRTADLAVAFTGIPASPGTLTIKQLRSDSITDTNESSENVRIFTLPADNFDNLAGISLPPFSMTVLKWASPEMSKR